MCSDAGPSLHAGLKDSTLGGGGIEAMRDVRVSVRSL